MSMVYGGVYGFLVEEYPDNPDENGTINIYRTFFGDTFLGHILYIFLPMAF